MKFRRGLIRSPHELFVNMLYSFLCSAFIIFSITTNAKAVEPVVTEAEAIGFHNDIGEASAQALSDHLINLFGVGYYCSSVL